MAGHYEHVRRPEPVGQFVGHCLAVLKRRLGTYEPGYQPRAGAICSHRNCNMRQCPGVAITEGYYIEVYHHGWTRLPTATTPIAAGQPLLAAPRATSEQCVRFISHGDHGEYTQQEIAPVIVPAYFDQSVMGREGRTRRQPIRHSSGGRPSSAISAPEP